MRPPRWAAPAQPYEPVYGACIFVFDVYSTSLRGDVELSSDLADFLRRANPVPRLEDIDPPDSGLLSRIMEEPRSQSSEPRSSDRSRRRRAIILCAVAALLVAGMAAAASKFVPEYFGADDTEPAPSDIVAALQAMSSGTIAGVDVTRLTRVAAFPSDEGRVQVYVAPAANGDGFCILVAVDATLGGGGCSGPAAGASIPYLAFRATEFGDVIPIVGRRTEAQHSIDVRFEDGGIRAASTRGEWWVYVVGGNETQPGHRPVELVARDSDGHEIAQHAIDPNVLIVAPD